MHFQALLCAIGALLVSQVSSAVIAERQSSGCAPLELYHAAGTSESGLGSIGTTYVTALPKTVPGAAVKPINYNTNVEYFFTVAAGAQTFQNVLTARAAACPNTKFVVSGYSKGALVVHAMRLSASVQSKVVAVTVFGDPNRGTSLANNVPINNKACYFSFCNDGDVFCDRGLSIAAHLSYANDGSVTTASKDIAGCYSA